MSLDGKTKTSVATFATCSNFLRPKEIRDRLPMRQLLSSFTLTFYGVCFAMIHSTSLEVKFMVTKSTIQNQLRRIIQAQGTFAPRESNRHRCELERKSYGRKRK
jgi:hypothetical protein